MTDPTTKTVRGWLVDILASFGLNTLPGILAELRYLNQRLWGDDATNPAPTYAALSDVLIAALSVPSVNAAGEPATVFLLQYLLGHLGPLNGVKVSQQLAGIASSAGAIRNQTLDSEGEESVGEYARQIAYIISVLYSAVGTGTGANSVQGILNSLKLLSTQANEYNEAYGTASSQVLADQLANLICICSNTMNLAPPPTQQYPPVVNACETEETIIGTISFSQWFQHTDGVWYCPPDDRSFEDGRDIFATTSDLPYTSFDDDYVVCWQARGGATQGGTFVLANTYNPNSIEVAVNSQELGSVGNVVVVEGPPEQIVGYLCYWIPYGSPDATPPDAVCYLELWQELA